MTPLKFARSVITSRHSTSSQLNKHAHSQQPTKKTGDVCLQKRQVQIVAQIRVAGSPRSCLHARNVSFKRIAFNHESLMRCHVAKKLVPELLGFASPRISGCQSSILIFCTLPGCETLAESEDRCFCTFGLSFSNFFEPNCNRLGLDKLTLKKRKG